MLTSRSKKRRGVRVVGRAVTALETLEARTHFSASSTLVNINNAPFMAVQCDDEGTSALVPINAELLNPDGSVVKPFNVLGLNPVSASLADDTGTGSTIWSASSSSQASATSSFTINVNFTGSGLTDTIRNAFNSAAADWMRIITAAPGGVTSLTIDATIAPIDGVGKILGQAGPTQLSNQTYIPTRGTMQFDSADLTNMANNGSLGDVVFHEMGHVLGFGTIWSYKNLTSGSSGDPRYTGTNAIAAYRSLGGPDSTIPLENVGGTGTVGAHWRESVFSNEVMTGYLNAGLNPVSIITIASMADLGYTVDMSAADSYVIPGVTPLGSGVVSGKVFTDSDQNGQLNNGETGSAGRTVYLDTNGNGVFDPGERSVVTSGDGSYTFNNLPANNYTPRLAIPAGSTVVQTSPVITVQLSNGATSSGNDIGLIDSAASVSGVVYSDANNNGAKDQGEAPLSGYTVFLDTNNNGVADTGELTTKSASDGSYAFNGLTPGNFTVRVQKPSTCVQTSGSSVTLGIAANVTNNVGVYDTAGTFTGTVFLDTNKNGKRDNGEAGLASRIIYLDVNNNGVLDSTERSTTTDANGFYTFTGVAAGTYRVRVLLTGTSTSQTAPVNVTVVANATTTGVDVGWYDSNGTIGGTLFSDPDNDGLRDPGEGGLGGITVYLDANNNGKLDTGERSVVTASDGSFAFRNLAAGSYTLRAVLPSLQVINSGNTVTLTGGTAINNLALPVFDTATSITGTVYTDTNGDGSKAAAEPGRSGATVYLDRNNNGVLDAGETSTTTDRSGSYRFTGVAPNNYRIRVVPPVGMLQTQPSAGAGYAIATVAGTVSAGNDFGVVLNSGTVEGSVFLDLNGDGVRSSSESGVSGIRVYVDLNNDGVYNLSDPSALTDSTGKYSIRNVTQGAYKLRVVLPGTLTQTTPAPNSPYSVQVTAGGLVSGKTFGVNLSRTAPAVRTVTSGKKLISSALLASEDPSTSAVVVGKLSLPMRGLMPAFSDRLILP